MERRFLEIVLGVLVVCSILLYLNKMLIKESKSKIITPKSEITHNIPDKSHTKKITSNREIKNYIKRVSKDVSIINKNWIIVENYATIKTWVSDENESNIKKAFIKINHGWDDISKLSVPNNKDCEKLHEYLINCKNIQNHAMSLASEAMNTSSFDLMVESTEIIVDSNKFINKNIEPLIKKIETNVKTSKS